MPVIVTSQLVMTLPEIKLVPIGDLSEQEALTLFNHYAGQDYSQNELAQELVQALAYHPYSLEIAGAIVKADGRIIRRRVDKIVQDPSDLELPFGGRPALGALLDESYDALSETAKKVFQAIGALSVSGATPDLLALLLGKDIAEIYDSLDELVFLSLARNQQIDWVPVNEDDIEYYDFHELTYQYSKIRFKDEQDNKTNLIEIMNQLGEQMEWKPAFVRAEICNFIGSAHEAQQQQADEDLITIMTGLTMYGYLDTYGHTNEFVELLDAAIEAVENQGESGHELLHYLVGKRGNVNIDRGQLAEARKRYEQALELAPSALRQIMALAVLGKVCYQMENNRDGDVYFGRGRAVLEAQENEVALGFLYQQQSVAMGLAEEYEACRNFAEQAVQINKQFADSNPPRYLFSLLNLGTAEERLGNLGRAVEIHTEGYEMALEKGLKRLAADMVYSLAQDLQALGQPEQVMGKLQQAQKLYHEAGEIAYEQSVIEYMRTLG
jgi:tetratricopeptide (TPR) repeat protein